MNNKTIFFKSHRSTWQSLPLSIKLFMSTCKFSKVNTFQIGDLEPRLTKKKNPLFLFLAARCMAGKKYSRQEKDYMGLYFICQNYIGLLHCYIGKDFGTETRLEFVIRSLHVFVILFDLLFVVNV